LRAGIVKAQKAAKIRRLSLFYAQNFRLIPSRTVPTCPEHRTIRERIESLRKQQQGLPSRNHIKEEMTNSNKDVLLAAKNKRIKVLENEVKHLKEQLKRLGGELYDSI